MQAAQLMEAGHVVFSPLSHSHRIAHYIDNHLDHEFWLKQCLPFVDMWRAQTAGDGDLTAAFVRTVIAKAEGWHA
jgi:hypothetical protein